MAQQAGFHSHLKDGAFTAVNLNGPIRTTFVVFTETNQTQPCPRIPQTPPPPPQSYSPSQPCAVIENKFNAY